MGTIGRIGVQEQDDEALRTRKAILASTVLLSGVPAQLLFGLFYLPFNENLAALACFAAALTMGVSILLFRAGHLNFEQAVFVSLLVPVLSPFLITLALGGLVNSDFVLVWGIVAPLFATVLLGQRMAVYWLLAFLVAVWIAFLSQPWLRADNNIPFAIDSLFTAMNLSGAAMLVFSTILFFTSQRDRAYGFLAVEQEKSEKLLLNVLPTKIAAILKDNEQIIADQFEGASILFADVVDFTPLSAGMTAEELVALLDEVFSYFDALVEKYGLEKIKTIGDCYMVAAGVPNPRADHAQAITRMAVEMRDYVAANTFCGRKLAFRIGINSGPVVAGVIGRKKFIYDLWGDAVNTASRMESNGRGDTIQITAATHALVQDEFVCQPQGTISVKGKGEMDVWYVLGERRAVA